MRRPDMKKSFVVFMTVIVIFLFSACVKHEDYSDETKRITMDVYDCLLEGDSEKLKSLFCEKTRNSPDFDRKVQDFMDGIGGCISSGNVDGYHYDVASRRRDKGTDFGDYDFLQTLGMIDNITDNNGINYHQLVVSYIYRDTDDPDCVGLYSIGLSDIKTHYSAYLIHPEEEAYKGS